MATENSYLYEAPGEGGAVQDLSFRKIYFNSNNAIFAACIMIFKKGFFLP